MIRIAIVEDDQSADDQLTACLEKLSLQSKEVFDLSHYPDAQQFLFAFHSQFDLIFMDIEMPNMDGLSAARRMREIDSNVALVFVTNLARYAINGYEVSALDYILKPLDYDAFYLKMQKVLRYCQTQQQRRQQSVVIPTADGNIHLPLSELLYVEVVSHTLIYHTLSHDYETYGTLKTWRRNCLRTVFPAATAAIWSICNTFAALMAIPSMSAKRRLQFLIPGARTFLPQ